MKLILGATIPFITTPLQSVIPRQYDFNKSDALLVTKAVQDLVANKCIVRVDRNADQFVSPLFLVTNKDGSKRPILNVRKLNKSYLPKKHFKMETLQSILPLIRRFQWFASWDLRKGYYNVAIHPDYQRFFCFEWQGEQYQFTCLVFGLALAPLFFTKIMATLVHLARSWICDCLLVFSEFAIFCKSE